MAGFGGTEGTVLVCCIEHLHSCGGLGVFCLFELTIINTVAGLLLVYKRPAENFNFALNWCVTTSVTSAIPFCRKAGSL